MYSLKTSERVLYGDTYLVISLEGKSLIPYQEDMLYENHLPGYLGFYTKFENEILVLYNITNCISLSDFIGDRKLTRRQYLMIVDSVVDAMILRDQFFLSENSLLINQDYIYIKDNSEIAMAYLPAGIDYDSKLALKEFVAWLTSKLDAGESGAGEAAIPLQLMISNPAFNLKVVKETIQQILSSGPPESVPRAHGQSHASKKPGRMDIPETPPNKTRQKEDGKSSAKKDSNLFGIGEKKKRTIAKPPEKLPNKNVKKRPPRDGYAEISRSPAQPEEERYADQIVYLLFKPNTAEEQIVQVDKSPFTIGRGETAHYQINDISISREHAKIVLDKNKVYLVDTKSKFGTYVNDSRLRPESAVELKDDDSVMFSGLAYTVKIVRMDDIYSTPR